jgi:hypothetical protein
MGAGDRTQLQQLSAGELIAALESPSEALPAGEALKELARRRTARASAVLAGVVGDARRPADLRATAAVQLGKDARPANQEALIAALPAADPQLTRRVAEALGRIGDERALEALKPLRPRDPTARRSVAFAKTLISYRLGLKEYRLTPPDPGELLPVQRARAVPLVARQEGAELLKRIAPTLRRELPAIRTLTRGALAFDCGDARFLVVLNRDVERPLPELTTRNTLAGVVLKRSPGLDRYSIYEYLLVHPDGREGLHLFAARTTGIVGHYGSARLGASEAQFTLRAVRTPYAPPLMIEGGYDARAQTPELRTALVYPDYTAAQKRGRARPARLQPQPR